MLGASFYIIICTARNRLRTRLARLREPRYLFGGIAGAAYLYFSVFARLWGSRRGSARRGPGAAGAPMLMWSSIRSSAPAAAGVGLLALTAASWAMPFDSGLLDFSEAETAFLFPAPVSRRALLVYRMMRSQLGLLFGALIMGIAMPSVGGFTRLRVGVAMWLLLFTGKVYFTGITLARARLTGESGAARRLAWLPVGVLTAAVAIVGAAILREFGGPPVNGMQDAVARLRHATSSPGVAAVLWPFMAVARPLFADWPGPYLRALTWAGAMLAAITVWMLKSDEAFQDAAADAAQKRASAKERRAPSARVRATSLPLAATGRPEVAFAWKAALQTLRVVDRGSLARAGAIVVTLGAIAVSASEARNVAAALRVFAAIGAGFAIVMGPQALRIDMRQDLRHLELLKTWPVKASAVVRGEMLWPGVFVTLIAWALLALALFLSIGGAFSPAAFQLRVAVGVSVALLAPALIFAQFAIHNGAALLFPGWVPLGTQRVRGLDAMGQRLIILGGTILTLVVMALPGALAGGIVWFALRRLAAEGAFVPAAAVCAAIIAIEVLLITEALGPVYERLDITAVEHAE